MAARVRTRATARGQGLGSGQGSGHDEGRGGGERACTLRPLARSSGCAICQRGVLSGWVHFLPHAGLASGGKKEKSGHGRSCEIVLAVGEKTGGMGRLGPYWPTWARKLGQKKKCF